MVEPRLLRRTSHVALCVPDLARSAAFAERVVGLTASAVDHDAAYLTAGTTHHELQLIQADELGLDHLAFEAWDVDALARICERLTAGGWEMLSQEPEPGVAASLRCVGPQGFIFEFVAGVDAARPRAPDHQSTRVRRLQHATLFVTDLDELEDFLVTVLGFVKTDVVPGAISWLRCGNDHHDLNLIHGDAPGYHHMGWEVDGLDDIGVMADHLAHHGRHLCWGPGRHAPGGVLFAYFRDDDRVLTEFCADIGNASGSDRSVREWPLSPFTANVWGVAAPADVHDLVVPIASRA